VAADRIIHGLAFFPRGGSAQVVRYLALAQRDAGYAPKVVTGSLGQAGDIGHAGTFFAGLPLIAADFGPAVRAWQRGYDPMAQAIPMHPSYEDRSGVPDRIFTALSPSLAEHQVRAWRRVLDRVDVSAPSVLHLHHLTPLHEAAMQRWPATPVVTHLHGTELLMMEAIRRSRGAADAVLPSSWAYADYWLQRLRTTARRSSHIVALSADHAERAIEMLGVSADGVSVIPNGVDVERFRPQQLSGPERLALLRRWLVEDPQGWDSSGRPGSIRYSDADLAPFVDGALVRPVLLFVGRFTAVKRLPLLLKAYARVRQRLGPIAPLLIWGGYPGEWEGGHPAELAAPHDGVFFLGWRGHDELPLGLACADLLVAPSVREAFGSVYLEAMAAGVPVVATRTGGPATFVNTDSAAPVGWLIPPDDELALTEVLVEALTHPKARRARGDAAVTFVQQQFSWARIAAAMSATYERARTAGNLSGR
jgi:glycosyltransferase involved in cell wall biosynthesis